MFYKFIKHILQNPIWLESKQPLLPRLPAGEDAFDDGIGEAVGFHSVNAFDGDAAGSGDLVDLGLRVVAALLEELHGAFHRLENYVF